jgi:hypothetical protein
MEIFYKTAKDINTGWYFDGNAFTATPQQAIRLAPNVTNIDFHYNWSHHDVVVEELDEPFVARNIMV